MKNIILIFFILTIIIFTAIYLSNTRLGLKEVQYLPEARFLLRVSIGHQHTLADFYFLDAIQYFGEQRNRDEEYRWLYPMLDIVTTLDPKYGTPYRWGGVVLPFFNGTEWKNVKESNLLLEKGIRHADRKDDRYWQVPFYLGWNAMAYERDYKKAGDYMALASKQVKGEVYPKYLGLLATKLYASAGDPDAGLRFAEEAYYAEKDPEIKKELEKRIKELTVERDLKVLNVAIKDFEKIFSRKPASFNELLEKGFIKSIPEEPFGGEYIIDESGEAKSTTYRKKLEFNPPEIFSGSVEKER